MSSWFRNLRDVTRFIYSYGFMANGLRTEESFEVDMVDLMVVESLRNFEPAVYDMISGRKSILVQMASGQASEELKELGELLLKAKGDRLTKKQFESVMTILFPSLREAWNGFYHSSGSFSERDKLVCAKQFFDRYFGFGLATGQLSELTIDRLKSARSDREEIRRMLFEFEKDGTLFEVLERMQADDEIIEDPTLAYPLSLGDMCDTWKGAPSKSMLGFSVPAYWYATRSAKRAITRRKTKAERLTAVEKLVSDSLGIIASADLLQDLIKKPYGFNFEELDEDLCERLKGQWVQRVKLAASNGSLAESESILSILHLWEKWGDSGDGQDWLKDLHSNAEGIIRLLTNLTNRSSGTSGDGTYREVRWISWQNLEKLSEIEVWENYEKTLSECDNDRLNEIEKALVKLLDEALKRWRTGIADGSFSLFDGEED